MDINESENGEVEAQNNLGECYYYGRGVPQNHEKAKMWHDKAKENGEELDEELLQEMKKAFNP